MIQARGASNASNTRSENAPNGGSFVATITVQVQYQTQKAGFARHGCYYFAFWLLFHLIFNICFSFCSVPFLFFCFCFCSSCCVVVWCFAVVFFCFCFCIFFSLFVFHFLLLLLLWCAIFMVCFPALLWCCSCLDVWFTGTPPSPQPILLFVFTIPLHSPSHARMHARTRTRTHTHMHTHMHTHTLLFLFWHYSHGACKDDHSDSGGGFVQR